MSSEEELGVVLLGVERAKESGGGFRARPTGRGPQARPRTRGPPGRERVAGEKKPAEERPGSLLPLRPNLLDGCLHKFSRGAPKSLFGLETLRNVINDICRVNLVQTSVKSNFSLPSFPVGQTLRASGGLLHKMLILAGMANVMTACILSLRSKTSSQKKGGSLMPCPTCWTPFSTILHSRDESFIAVAVGIWVLDESLAGRNNSSSAE